MYLMGGRRRRWWKRLVKIRESRIGVRVSELTAHGTQKHVNHTHDSPLRNGALRIIYRKVLTAVWYKASHILVQIGLKMW